MLRSVMWRSLAIALSLWAGCGIGWGGVQAASAATPPRMPRGLRCEAELLAHPELVDLIEWSKDRVEHAFAIDVRYARNDNFLGRPFYSREVILLDRPVAEALIRVQKDLAESGHGLLIYDGYRPWSVTQAFWDLLPERLHTFLANPMSGSTHNRGTAVDVSMVRLATGLPVEMPSDFDELSVRAHSEYLGANPSATRHRGLLRAVMERHGFTGIAEEWWHWEHESTPIRAVMDLPI